MLQTRRRAVQVVSWKDLEDQRVNENITRKMFWGDHVMVTRWELAPNTLLPLHDHVSEQVTMVIEGSITLSFPGEKDCTLTIGDMIVIPSSKPHSAKAGPEGAIVSDIFSPIRTDLIQSSQDKKQPGDDNRERKIDEAKAYGELHGFLVATGVKIGLDDLQQIPLELVARYVYERECISLGQLRTILGLDKSEAKDLLRQWKHGDDHSESSYRRKLERMIVLPTDLRSS
jgi:quercetin dioxygenase-like cupin family protein